jgi:hypothetical protein
MIRILLQSERSKVRRPSGYFNSEINIQFPSLLRSSVPQGPGYGICMRQIQNKNAMQNEHS